MIIYAGAASEELVFGQYCSGCFGSETADFESAVRYIKEYIVMTDNTVSKTMLEEENRSKSDYVIQRYIRRNIRIVNAT